MFNVIRHLIQRSRYFRLTNSDLYLRKFYEGLSPFLDDIKEYSDLSWSDMFPETTRELDAWEQEFGLIKNSELLETQRRARIDNSWKSLGGQGKDYLESRLRGAAFDVYVHPGTAGLDPGTLPVSILLVDGKVYPAIPTDPLTFPFLVYVTGGSITDTAIIDSKRRAEFETLILKLFPAERLIVLNVQYIDLSASIIIDDNSGDTVLDDNSGDVVLEG